MIDIAVTGYGSIFPYLFVWDGATAVATPIAGAASRRASPRHFRSRRRDKSSDSSLDRPVAPNLDALKGFGQYGCKYLLPHASSTAPRSHRSGPSASSSLFASSADFFYTYMDAEEITILLKHNGLFLARS
jgi:hypothetical protein